MNNARGSVRASVFARRLGLSAVLLAAGMSLSLLSAGVAAAADGAISGTVIDAGSKGPIEEIRVCAETSFSFGGCDYTEADGTYTIADMPPADYKVSFAVPYGGSANYISQYYKGKSSWSEANLVTVAGGATKSGVDAEMQVGGRIAGEVVAAAGKAPLDSIEVCAFEVNGAEELVDCVETDGDGEYALSGLPSGPYKIRFAPGYGEISPGEYGLFNYVTQYYDGKATLQEADPVTVTAGATTTGIDAELEVGGTLSGQVTDAAGTDPIQNAEVCAYLAGEVGVTDCDSSDEDGEYSISGLATGSYEVAFFGDQGHARQYYDGKATLAAADPVPVTQGATTPGIDAELLELGRIAGKVTAASGGAPIGSIEVCASSLGQNYDSGCDATDAGGEYEIAGLQEGDYRVVFRGGLDFVSEHYDDATSESGAKPVQVTNATTAGSIDAALQTAGKISGKVVDAAGKAALQGIEVCARTPSEGPISAPSSCTVSGADGKYTIGGLPAGTYPVRFSVPYFNIVNYLPQFYAGHAYESDADAVTVTPGATTPSIDAEMQPGGTIGGKVVDAGGKAPLEGISVCATSIGRRGGAFGNCDSTDAAGEYGIDRLSTGSYKVRFAPSFGKRTYVAQYFSGEATKALADPVAVTAGAATPGIDAEMHQGGKIEGEVVDAVTESPLKAINVCLGGNFESCVTTDAAGKYTIEGLATGSYKLGFFWSYQNRGYVDQYYDGKATREAADPVGVSEGATVTGIDAELQPGGKIAGAVTDAVSGDPADAVQACAYDATSGDYEGCGYTDSDGEYAIEGLRTGSYRVRFSPGAEFFAPGVPTPNYNYVSQYHDGKATEAAADPVAVTAGATTPNVDAAMHEGGQIEGQIVDAVTKAPLAYSSACVYIPADEEYSHCDSPGLDGKYTIEGLPTGSYKVEFSAYGGNYLSQYYDDAASAAAATPVAVTALSAHTGIDAELHAGGQIKGQVTAASDGAPLAFVSVCALETGGEEEPFRCAETQDSGRYTISGLPSGSYKVEFQAIGYEAGFGEEEFVEEEEFATQYYDAKSSAAQAIPVAVTAGGATGSIDAQMTEPTQTQATLTVSLAGTGAGTVTSSPAGISCGLVCAHSFAKGASMTLTAAPGGGSTFAGWSGACSGAGTCNVTLGANAGVTALFEGAGGGGTAGGGGSTPAGGGAAGGAVPPPLVQGSPRPAPKLPKCKKGFKKKKVRGVLKCVRSKPHKKKRG